MKLVCLVCPALSSNIPISLMRKQGLRGVQYLTEVIWTVLSGIRFPAWPWVWLGEGGTCARIRKRRSAAAILSSALVGCGGGEMLKGQWCLGAFALFDSVSSSPPPDTLADA